MELTNLGWHLHTASKNAALSLDADITWPTDKVREIGMMVWCLPYPLSFVVWPEIEVDSRCTVILVRHFLQLHKERSQDQLFPTIPYPLYLFSTAENKWMELIVTVICYVTIFNFMYLENLYFIECIVMALSLLLYSLGAYILANKSKGYIFKSALCVIIGMISYQGTIGFFLALVFLFSILKNKNKVSSIIKDILISGVLVIIAGLIDLTFIKIFTTQFGTNQGRLSNNLLNNILVIFMYFPEILTDTCGMFPPNLFIVFLSLLTLIAIVAIGYKDMNKLLSDDLNDEKTTDANEIDKKHIRKQD